MRPITTSQQQTSTLNQTKTATDIGSFFDQVNALMEKNKLKQQQKQQQPHHVVGQQTKAMDDRHQNFESNDSSFQEKPSSTLSSPSSSTRSITPSNTIHDLFPAAPRSSKNGSRDANAYGVDETSFDRYSELIESIMEGPKFLKRKKQTKTTTPWKDEEVQSIMAWLRSESPAVDTKLPMLENALRDGFSVASSTTTTTTTTAGDSNNLGLNTPSTVSENKGDEDVINSAQRFREELTIQRKAFMDHQGWNAKQYEVAMGALASLGNQCAKLATAPPLEIAWQKLKEAGYNMDKNIVQSYLYVSSTFSLPHHQSSTRKYARANGVGSILDFFDGISDASNTADESDSGRLENEGEQGPSHQSCIQQSDEIKRIDVASELALCHDLLFGPTEQSTSILVRKLVSQGKAKEAEKLLDASTVSV
jgi:hypothetical protein